MQAKYMQHVNKQQNDDCQFCGLDDPEQLVKTTRSFIIIKNIFPYDLWDARHVEDHLMLVPKQHTESVSTLGDAEKIEFANIIGAYEKLGYDVYARSPHSTIKSVPHQHTHLIKTTGKRIEGLHYTETPYTRTVINE